MTGREAYEDDVRGCPLYNDGKPRLPWGQLSRVIQESWERDPTPRCIYPIMGTFYSLPEGVTWEHVAASRAKHDISKDMAPLALGPAVMAWGTLLPCNYRLVRS